MGRVASLPCCIANAQCHGRITVHHLTGGKSSSQKNDDFETIPLYQAHHQDGGRGIAIHAGVQTWEEKYGTQDYFLTMTRYMLAKICPSWCVFTGVPIDPRIDQTQTITSREVRKMAK